jgi:hypothetical protein
VRGLEALYPAPGVMFLVFNQSTLLLPFGVIVIPRFTSHARRVLSDTYNHCAFIVSKIEGARAI